MKWARHGVKNVSGKCIECEENNKLVIYLRDEKKEVKTELNFIEKSPVAPGPIEQEPVMMPPKDLRSHQVLPSELESSILNFEKFSKL